MCLQDGAAGWRLNGAARPVAISTGSGSGNFQEKAVQDAARDEETAKQKAVTAQQNFDLKKQELEAAKKKATEAKEKVALCEKAVEDAKKKIPINHLSGE